jgi:hypothetical protein
MIDTIIKAGKSEGLTTPQIAYILATAEHETNNTFRSVAEGYYKKNPQAFQRSLRYYPYFGRGLVQLTWKNNYERAQNEVIKKLGYNDVDIVKNPDWLTSNDPRVDDVNARILIQGIRNGWFTSKPGTNLETYIPKNGTPNYRGARYLVNVQDKADKVAGHAVSWERELKKQQELENKYVKLERFNQDVDRFLQTTPDTKLPSANIYKPSNNGFVKEN